jgi:hypothetical protein
MRLQVAPLTRLLRIFNTNSKFWLHISLPESENEMFPVILMYKIVKGIYSFLFDQTSQN